MKKGKNLILFLVVFLVMAGMVSATTCGSTCEDCTTAVGSGGYVELTSDLTADFANCLSGFADSTVFNCDGHTISLTGIGSTSGILLDNHVDGVTIANCTFTSYSATGAKTGIKIYDYNNNITILNNTFTDLNSDGILLYGLGVGISNVSVYNNTFEHITGDSKSAIFFQAVTNTTIVKNNNFSDVTYGIRFYQFGVFNGINVTQNEFRLYGNSYGGMNNQRLITLSQKQSDINIWKNYFSSFKIIVDLMGIPTGSEDTANFCVKDVDGEFYGNYYANQSGFFKFKGDCGPHPNVHQIYIDEGTSIIDDISDVDWGASGTKYYHDLREGMANLGTFSNYQGDNKIKILDSERHFFTETVINYVDNVSLDCGDFSNAITDPSILFVGYQEDYDYQSKSEISGAGVLIKDSSNITIINCNFTDNGIQIEFKNSFGLVNITNNLFTVVDRDNAYSAMYSAILFNMVESSMSRMNPVIIENNNFWAIFQTTIQLSFINNTLIKGNKFYMGTIMTRNDVHYMNITNNIFDRIDSTINPFYALQSNYPLLIPVDGSGKKTTNVTFWHNYVYHPNVNTYYLDEESNLLNYTYLTDINNPISYWWRCSDPDASCHNYNILQGGNNWEDYDCPIEECFDYNRDGFCDSPYDAGFTESHYDKLPLVFNLSLKRNATISGLTIDPASFQTLTTINDFYATYHDYHCQQNGTVYFNISVDELGGVEEYAQVAESFVEDEVDDTVDNNEVIHWPDAFPGEANWKKGDVIRFKATAFDDYDLGDEVYQDFTVQNTNPSGSVLVAITDPIHPISADTLTCTATPSITDPDVNDGRDNLHYTYKWYNNYNLVATHGPFTNDEDDTLIQGVELTKTPGMTVRCAVSVTDDDGISNIDSGYSIGVIINTPPTLESTANWDVYYDGSGTHGVDSDLKTGVDITKVCMDYDDADGDYSSAEVNFQLKIGATSLEGPIVVDSITSTPEEVCWILSSSHHAHADWIKGNTVSILATPNDGYEDGILYQKDILIGNTAPTTPTDLDAGIDKFVGQIISATCTDSTDIDGDSPLDYYYEFCNNDLDPSCSNPLQSYSMDYDYEIQEADAHYTIRVYCKVYDGEDWSGVDTDDVFVLNSDPADPTAVLTYDNPLYYGPYVDDELYCDVTPADPDDVDGDSVSYEVTWYVKGLNDQEFWNMNEFNHEYSTVDMNSLSWRVIFGDSPDEAAYISSGKQFKCRIKALDDNTPYQGESSWVYSNPLTIHNSIPMIGGSCINLLSAGQMIWACDDIYDNIFPSMIPLSASFEAEDEDEDNLMPIMNFEKDGTSIMRLNMPFEIDAKDYSGLSNDGTISGATLVSYGSRDPTDTFDSLAYEFDGTDDYISISDIDDNLDFSAEDSFTLSAWIFTDVEEEDQWILGKVYGSDEGYYLKINSHNYLEFYAEDSEGRANYIKTKSTYIEPSTWYHVVVTHTDSVIDIYVNGKEEDYETYSIEASESYANTKPLYIGRDFENSRWAFTGVIDNVMIYNRYLSSQQVELMYNDGAFDPHLLAKEETETGSSWKACMYVFDKEDVSEEECTNEVEIVDNIAPMLNSTYLNATTSSNSTNDNLTAWPVSLFDPDGNDIKEVYNWYLSGSSLETLNLPFETNTPQHTAIDDQVGAWYFDGDATDETTNGNDGTVSGATQVSGHMNYAYDFDGVNDKITIPNDAVYNFDTDTSFTVSFWVKFGTPKKNSAIVEKWSTSASGYPFVFRVYDNARVSFARYDGSSATASYTTSSVGNNSAWHLITATRDAPTDTMKIYFDGVLEDTDTDTTSASTQNAYPIYVGARNGVEYFDGQVDELMIWDRTLDEDEVHAVYEEGVNSNLEAKDYSDNYGHMEVNGPTHTATGGVDGFGAYTFDGTNDLIKLPTSTRPTDDFTISMWFKLDQEPSTQGTHPGLYGGRGLHNSPDYGVALTFYSGNNRLYFDTYTPYRTYSYSSTTTWGTGWHHVVAKREGSNQQLWIDGVRERSTTVTGGTSSVSWTASYNYVGIGRAERGYLDGTIDEFKQYDYALSDEQIGALYLREHNILVSDETSQSEVYSVCMTPNDGTLDGEERCSNSLTVQA
jgi:hypothetical protein